MKHYFLRVLASLAMFAFLGLPAKATEHQLDFNGDNRADIFWRNAYNGATQTWLIGGTSILQSVSYGTISPTSGWRPVGAGDLNGDNRTDIFWYRTSTGAIAAWLSFGTGVQTINYGSISPTAGWMPIGMKDFDADGRSDVFWYNVYNGNITLWFMNGSQILRAVPYTGLLPSTGWVPAGFHDFDGDGRADILWHQIYTGGIGAWLMKSTGIQAVGYYTVPPTSGWRPVGIGDLNGDNRTDIFWHHVSTGTIQAWLSTGPGMQIVNYGAIAPSSGWMPIGVEDFSGDGRSDVSWYNAYTGDTRAWFMNGSQILQEARYGVMAPTTGRVPAGFLDLSGDGRADILWYHVHTGTLSSWLVAGTSISQSVTYGAMSPASGWRM